MKANKITIGLESAKLLKDCGVVATQYYTKYFSRDGTETLWEILPPQILPEKYEKSEFYHTFTWGEILWEHSKKFFPEYRDNDDNNKRHSKALRNAIFIQILELLQQKKYEEADLYFRQNCKLIERKK